MVAATVRYHFRSVRSPVLLFSSLLVAVVIAPAQQSAADFEARPIARIEFEPANQPLPAAELERLLPLHPGAPLKQADVRQAIQKLYQTGRYSDISIEGRLEDNKVVVRIVTQFSYFVSEVIIVGVAHP